MAKKATATPKSLSVEMTFKKSTPGTHVYELERAEGAAKPLCTQVYLSRAELGEEPPASIKLTVEF